jgi:hypothetical protein
MWYTRLRLKKYKTKKLYYEKYPYRLNIDTTMSRWFDFPRLREFKKLTEELEKKFKRKKHLDVDSVAVIKPYWREIEISYGEYVDALAIKAVLQEHLKEEHTIRRERTTLMVYDTDRKVIDALIKAVPHICVDLTEPDLDDIEALMDGKLIVSEKYSKFQYKVVLRAVRDPDFPDWIAANKGKLMLSDYAANNLRKDNFMFNPQLYVSDERMMFLLNLRLSPDQIYKVYELEHK